MNKLRYINLGEIDPEFYSTCWEYPRIITPKNPTLFVFRVNKTTVARAGQERLDEVMKTNEIPKGLKITRIYGKDSGGFLLTPDMVSFYIHFPAKLKNEFNKAMQVVVIKALKQYNIKIEKQSNDLYFINKGKRKKFSGMMTYSFNKDWITLAISILFKFDSELGSKIFKLDNKKFTKKGDIKDVNDIVGGLWEIDPEIDIDKVSETIAQKIGERFNLEIEKSDLTKNELLRMNKLANKLNNKEWQLYGKRP